jgi:hypothetical protein
VRAADGSVYASNDFSSAGIARVVPGGRVQNFWSPVNSANGLVIDSGGRYLYAAQTFQPAAVARVDLAHPERVETYFAAEGADMPAGPDGMTRDQRDRLFVAANGAGQVWRIDGPGHMCVLARGLPTASSLIFGSGTRGFPSTSLFVVTFTGLVVELPGAREAPMSPAPTALPGRPRLSLRVRPRRLVVGRRTRVSFLVRSAGRPVARARVHFARRTIVTNRAGRATALVRLRRPGTLRARAYRSGYRRAVPVRVVAGRARVYAS